MGLIPRRLLVAVLAFAASGRSVRAQPAGEAPELPGWVAERLTSLDPADPAAYFLLGEDVLGAMASKAEEELASRLFALAYELDRADERPSWIAPSSCLALASFARLESDGRWLRALAGRLDPDYAAPAWRSPDRGAALSAAAFDAAEAVGEARAGNGAQTRDLLDKPGVRDLLLRYGRLLGYTAGTGALWQVERWSEEWPCRECGNERVVFRPNTDPPSYRECYTCRGNPGPVLSEPQVVAQLRFESRMLHGISRSWSAQLAIDDAAPLRDPSPDELASVMGVDPGKPYWRDGWVADPGAPPEPPTLDQQPIQP